MRHLAIVVSIALAQAGGCNHHSAEPAAEPFAGTTASVDRPRPGATPGPELLSVRTEHHPGFVRSVFEFRGNALPGYHAGYLEGRPHACGSGQPVSMAGSVWLELRMSPARAHGEHGANPSFKTDLTPSPGPLLELRQICDFEGVVSWVLGLGQRVPYRVRELDKPARLVVDVAAR